jgi:oligopeptide transport system permease protein
MDIFDLNCPPHLPIIYGIFLIITLFYALIKTKMIHFFMGRLLTSLIILLIVLTLSFFLMRFLPGGPFDEERILPTQVKLNIEKKYKLDRPLVQQYFSYLSNSLKGQLGQSYRYEGQEVKDIISDTLPITFKLGLYSILLAFILGVPMGVLAASRQGTVFDKLAMFIAVSGISMPSFLLAPLLIYFFSFGWPLNLLLPKFHQFLLNNDLLLPVALWQSPKHYILPVISLGVRPAAIVARLTRASMLDVINSDFVRTARAKGLKKNIILYQHILGNSLIPVLSYAGPLVAGILSGSFVVETIFAIPGIAKYFIQGVFNRDYPLVMGLTLLFSVLLICANLIVDVIYKILDPRIEII